MTSFPGLNPTPPPKHLLSRLTGHLRSVAPSGAVRLVGDKTIELVLDDEEATTGGVAMISFETDIHCRRCGEASSRGCERCSGIGRERELVSFWVTIPPRVADGAVVRPSVDQLKLVNPMTFVVRTPPSAKR